MTRMPRIVAGVISDTHGSVTREAARALAGVEHLICAGDIVADDVIPALRTIAPDVTAVRGNMDWKEPARSLPEVAEVTLGGVRILVIHDRYRLDGDTRGVDVIVHGHTHRASVEREDGVLFVNPGSAGSPRHGRPATVARLVIEGGRVDAEIIEIDGSPAG